jgi:hypothetical protein
MVIRIFQQQTDNTDLTCYLNTNNQIYIEIKTGEDYTDVQCTVLDLDDAVELRNELDRLIKEMV